jgi:DNA-binding transcriptional LysR family regulator
VSLTPAAFGQRIRQLEEQLEVRLFERTTRTVHLTEAGIALLPAARSCIAAAGACVAAAKGESGRPAIELTLGTRFELGMSWLVPLLDVIEARHPHVTLNLYFGSGPELLYRLRVLAIDAVITSARLTTPTLDAFNLHEEAYAFVGACERLRAAPLEEAADAAEHVLLDVDEELPLYRYLSESPESPGPLRFADYRFLGLGAAVKARVLGGHGVAVLPRYLIEDELADGRLTRALPDVPLLSDHFRLVFRRDDPRRSAYAELAETLAAAPIR